MCTAATCAALLVGGLVAGHVQRASAAFAAEAPGTITTYAGGGVGDHGPATGAMMYPSQVAVDASGALYVTDDVLARLRVIRDGVITTVAGTGEPGHTGDNGSATQAQIDASVEGLAVDRSGDVYFSERGSGRIRKIDSHGVITTVASNLLDPKGLALDAAGNLYVAETNLSVILEYPGGSGTPVIVAGNGVEGYTGDGVPATAASLDQPYGVAVDSEGNLFIADTFNNRIREVDHATKSISTVLPIPGAVSQYTQADTSVVYQPQSVTLDGHGVLYVCEIDRVLFVASGAVTTVATIPPDSSEFMHGIAVVTASRYDTLYVAFMPVGAPPPGGGEWGGVDQVITNATYHSPGTLIAGSADGNVHGQDRLPATDVDMRPAAVVVDPAGHLVIADATRVLRVTATGDIETVAGTGTMPTGCSACAADVVPGDPSRTNIDGLPARALNLAPISVAVASNGDVYFGDGYPLNEVLRVGRDGIVHVVAGCMGTCGPDGQNGDRSAARNTALKAPQGIAIGPGGDVYVSDLAGVVRHIDTDGIITTYAGSVGGTCPAYNSGVSGPANDGPALQACLSNPVGLALDHSGNLFIAEQGADRVRRVDTGGTISTVVGVQTPGVATNTVAFTGAPSVAPADGAPAAANLNGPTGVALDGAGNLYIADTGNRLVRRVDASLASITTVAGSSATTMESWVSAEEPALASLAPSRGDGGPATSASLQQPAGLAFDASGNLYIADRADHRVRRVSGTGAGAHASGVDGAAPHLDAPTPWDDVMEDWFILSPHPLAHPRRDAPAAMVAGATVAGTDAPDPGEVGHNGGVRHAWTAPSPRRTSP